MHKPTFLLTALLCSFTIIAQQTDSIVIYYKSDQFTLSKPEKNKIDLFLAADWDRIFISGYTDETDDEDYNYDLSKKRCDQVNQYLLVRKVERNKIISRHFGEMLPIASNDDEEGRALNRRTVIVGFRYPRVTQKKVVTNVDTVTRTLDNGMIVSYNRSNTPASIAERFDALSGAEFQVFNNTTDMRANNLYNNTTRGEILSSVMIVCGSRLNPCLLDSPIIIKVPIPFRTKCPLSKIKFFNAVVENGKRIWQEETRSILPETINGQQYLSVRMNNFCECINFDIKIDPDCFDVDSAQLWIVNAKLRSLTAELDGMNSLYLPPKISDSTHRLIFLKDAKSKLAVTFTLLDGKRRVKTFRNQKVNTLPFDTAMGTYRISASRLQLFFPRLKVDNVVLKVNGDKYRITPEKNKYDFLYLNRPVESIVADFSIIEGRNKVTNYHDQPLSSLPYDPVRGYYIIDRKYLKTLREPESGESN